MRSEDTAPGWTGGGVYPRTIGELAKWLAVRIAEYRDFPNQPNYWRVVQRSYGYTKREPNPRYLRKQKNSSLETARNVHRWLEHHGITGQPEWPSSLDSWNDIEPELSNLLNFVRKLADAKNQPPDDAPNEPSTLQLDDVVALRRAKNLKYDPTDKDIEIVMKAIESAPGDTAWKGIGKMFWRMRNRKPTDDRWLSPMRAAATIRHLAQKGCLQFHILDGRKVVSVTDEGYLLGNDAKAKPAAGVTPTNSTPPKYRAGGEVDGQPLTVKFIKDVFGWDGSTIGRNVVDRIDNPDGRGYVYTWKSLCSYGKKRGVDVEAEYRKWQSSPRKVRN